MRTAGESWKAGQGKAEHALMHSGDRERAGAM